jgi:hypothetical protein
MPRPRSRWSAPLVAAACCSLFLFSCATLTVSDRAGEVHPTYWTIKQVLKARQADGDLWLLLDLKRERSNFSKTAALRLPTQDATWLLDQGGRAACPSTVPWERAPGVSPQATDLRDEEDFPSTGQDIEVQNLELSDPKDLSGIETKGDAWTILFVKFKPAARGDKGKRKEIPVLAVVRGAAPGQESEKCVLYSFFIGTTRHEGWVLVAPFAMAFDAVTLPIQLLGLLWWFFVGE